VLAHLARLRSQSKKKSPKGGISLSLYLVGSKAIRQLNQQWRGKNAETDVLSFPLGTFLEDRNRIHLGEIVISVPKAQRQGAMAGNSLKRELEILAVHGVLHLLGFDHEGNKKAATQMARWERRLLGPKGLIDRTGSLT
jgi:probable rRNA maturation factor